MFTPHAAHDGGKKEKHGEGLQEHGDGLHHHEIHEDEGGGFHSKHTHPDGTVEHDDHATYDDAKAKQDEQFGQASEHDHGGDDEGGEEPFDADDIAGSYGRAASEDEE